MVRQNENPAPGLETETINQQDLRYKGVFDKLDINHDGKIRFNSMKKAFNVLDHPLKDSDVAMWELFKSMDCNKDNVVDFEDFTKFASSAELQIDNGFKKIDSDHDGVVQLSEVSKYLSSLENKGRIVIRDDKLIVDDPGEETCTQVSERKQTFKSFYKWAFLKNGKKKDSMTDKEETSITYEQWRDFLLLMPRKSGSRLHTAFSYYYLFREDVDLSSEGDMTFINEFFRGFAYFFAGGVSGVISRSCTAPFDRIKVFLIARTDLSSTLLNSKENVLARNPRADVNKIRSPIVKAISSLYRQGGLRAFYVGNGLNAFKVFPESSIKFGCFELTKQLMTTLEGRTDKADLSRLSTYIAGGLAGVAAQFSVYPIDTLKFRIQCAPLEASLKDKKLLMNTAKQMYRDGGPLIFYRGVTLGLLGIFPYAALDLGTFSALKKMLITRKAKKLGVPEKEVTLSNLVVLPMGAFSGTVGATLVYPINLLRTRLQAQGTYAHPYTYTGFRDVVSQTFQREGYPGFYKGLIPTLAKVCPAVSISYLCYENLKKFANLD